MLASLPVPLSASALTADYTAIYSDLGVRVRVRVRVFERCQSGAGAGMDARVVQYCNHRWSVRSYAYAVICDLKGVRTYVRVRTSGPYAYASCYVRTTSGHD